MFYQPSLRRIATPLACAVCLLFALAGGADAALKLAAEVTISEKQNGQSVCLKRGEVLVVRLPAQLGTGYGWQLAEYKPELLRPLGEPAQERPEESRPGGAETQVFRFEAVGGGAGALKLRYARPWEKDKQPAKVFRVEVRVE